MRAKFINEYNFERNKDPFKTLGIGKKRDLRVNIYNNSDLIDSVQFYGTFQEGQDKAKKEILKNKRGDGTYWASISYYSEKGPNPIYKWHEAFKYRVSLKDGEFTKPFKDKEGEEFEIYEFQKSRDPYKSLGIGIEGVIQNFLVRIYGNKILNEPLIKGIKELLKQINYINRNNILKPAEINILENYIIDNIKDFKVSYFPATYMDSLYKIMPKLTVFLYNYYSLKYKGEYYMKMMYNFNEEDIKEILQGEDSLEFRSLDILDKDIKLATKKLEIAGFENISSKIQKKNRNMTISDPFGNIVYLYKKGRIKNQRASSPMFHKPFTTFVEMAEYIINKFKKKKLKPN